MITLVSFASAVFSLAKCELSSLISKLKKRQKKEAKQNHLQLSTRLALINSYLDF